ncbi:hypothetical protein [Tetragenococcus halophilus]|uniref:hypothetical protein n=1 Tax=Tetragenococcus halophilus TaxID=51669 RepID=UPI00295E379F|nr:hypothetical protein [Tetragenococcus halophilus]
MDLYRKIIIDLYFNCFPKKNFRDEFFIWKKATRFYFVSIIVTCCLLLSYIAFFDESVVVVSALYFVLLGSFALFTWSMKKNSPTLAERLKVKEKQLMEFDEKLKAQGIIRTAQIYEIIDYFVYINALKKYETKETKDRRYIWFMSIYIPLLVFFGKELWELVKENFSTTGLYYIIFYCILILFLIMLISCNFFSLKKELKNVVKNDEEKVVIILREIIVYRNNVGASLVDNEKIRGY